ncbi:hypothetical protein NQ318_012503 [Aromia moschata]|uniref:Uncharacterized protein n=1 Tax=Aromia moschata TaxID=1265417 RepID=A0AAV8XDX4_9CUCU|nr:hypothetical protein NQ318_012503 [Aromia moschata]
MECQQTRTLGEPKAVPVQNVEIFSGPASPGLGITSPRQRNRIRTNPWVPGSVPSPSPVKHVNSKENAASKPVKESPRLRRFLSPVITRRRSLSSSSCSSLSGTSLHLEPPRHSASDDDDCTLNEMMGKYDESYVYEKETDILSDSDPTDCETDIDTGQDGGDEDDLYEGELDFIDNGSYLECESRPDRNTGHCSYYNYDVHRKRSSRRRTTRKSSKQSSEKRRKSSSNKKRQPKQIQERDLTISHLDGSKSAGATPVSVRRAGYSPASRIALDVCLKKRSNSVSFYRDQHSNSVSFYRDHLSSIDRRDKEADIKYKELIFEADKLLRTMKTNGLSPRRLGPTNKRVELLRSTECSKPDVYIKNSPKKSHITNFIMNNSPIMVKKEWEMQNQGFKSPLCSRKRNEENHQIQKGILHRDKNTDIVRMSPKTQKKIQQGSSCNMHKTHGNGKTVAFKLTNEMNDIVQSSTENLRQQVLLNTIVNLKKNLENQSASLKQVYSSSQNVYV